MTITYLSDRPASKGRRIIDTGSPRILSDHATAERRAALLLNARDRLTYLVSRGFAVGTLLGMGWHWLARMLP